MKVLRKLRRPRWLVLVGCLVVAAPAVLMASGVSTGAGHATSSQAGPLVDRDYMYGQLFNMAYSDVYRVSGADGDPHVVQAGGTDAFNVPSTINGWKEFFLHWKAQLTDKTVMTNVVEVRDGAGSFLPSCAAGVRRSVERAQLLQLRSELTSTTRTTLR